MGTELRQTTLEDIDRLSAFLQSVFQARAGEPLINPLQMRWKFYDPRPDWPGSRSYVLDQTGSIVAHCTLVPVTFLTPRGKITSLNPLDWGASHVGGGVQLLRRLHGLSDTFLGFDASKATYDMLSKLRYKAIGTLELYSRVIRPVYAFRSHLAQGRLEAALKLIRDGARALRPRHVTQTGWTATRVPAFDDTIQKILPGPHATVFTPAERSVALLNYMLRCPVAEFSGFLVYRAAELRGYFLLSRVGSQGRIADIYVDSDDPRDWHIAFALATHAAAQDLRIHEVLAGAAVPFLRSSLVKNGFRRISQDPIFLYDPKDLFAHLPPPNLSLIDGDLAYL